MVKKRIAERGSDARWFESIQRPRSDSIERAAIKESPNNRGHFSVLNGQIFRYEISDDVQYDLIRNDVIRLIFGS